MRDQQRHEIQPTLAEPLPHRILHSTKYLALAATMFLAGCEWRGKPDPADRPLRPSQVTDFDTLFQQSCTGCHGADGAMGPAPALNDPLFLAIVPEEVLRDVVTNGRPGTLMPAFIERKGGSLTAEQIDIIVTNIRARWSNADKLPAPPLPEYRATIGVGGRATGDVERGRTLFAATCAGCHGADGLGGELAGALNSAPFLALASDQLLRRITITGRPELGMPNFVKLGEQGPDKRPLTNDQVNDLVALLASWRVASGDAASATAAITQAPP